MRRLLPLLLAALLLAGCGEERPGAPVTVAASYSPAPTTEPTTEPDGSLSTFPLALGYDAENGDDHSPVRVTRRPATQAFELCGVPAWDPSAGTTEVLGVEWRGEAEWSRGRTLALYPSVGDAVRALADVRDALIGCPEEQGAPDYGTTHTLLDLALGDESVVWADTYWFAPGGEKLHDTGLTVYDLARVGRAVLLSYEYGEGNGSDESRRAAIDRAIAADQPVVDAMRGAL
jgi:hypothetical protein